MKITFGTVRPIGDITLKQDIYFWSQDGKITGYEFKFEGICILKYILVTSDFGETYEVTYINPFYYEATFDDLLNLATAIVDTESNLPQVVSICRNAVSSLSDKKFIVIEYENCTKKLAVISNGEIRKIDLSDPGFTMFGLDLYVFEYGESQYAIMQVDEYVQANDRMVVIKEQIPNGMYDLRQDKYMRNICDIIMRELVDTMDVSIFKKYDGIHLRAGTIVHTRIEPSDSEIYKELKFICDTNEHVSVGDLDKLAKKSNLKNLKSFLTRVRNLGYKFNLFQFDVYGTTYTAVISGRSSTDRTIILKRNMCYVSHEQDVHAIIRIKNILTCLDMLKDPYNVVVYYPENNSIAKKPILEFINNCSANRHILYVDPKNDMYVYSAQAHNVKSHGKCKLFEIDGNVLVFTTDKTLVYTPKDLKTSTVIDKEDYEYFVMSNT